MRWRDPPATQQRLARKRTSEAFVGLDHCRASFALVGLVLDRHRLSVDVVARSLIQSSAEIGRSEMISRFYALMPRLWGGHAAECIRSGAFLLRLDQARPLAGVFAETIFALGIIGTELLAIPVLAAPTAYAIGEGRRWSVGLSRKPEKAVAFYVALAVSVLLGIGLNFTPLNPIKALYWSAVINWVLAPPVMILLMLTVRKEHVMG